MTQFIWDADRLNMRKTLGYIAIARASKAGTIDFESVAADLAKVGGSVSQLDMDFAGDLLGELVESGVLRECGEGRYSLVAPILAPETIHG